MKKLIALILLTLPFLSFSQRIITEDIANFWKAFDKIVLEKDSLKQLELIKTIYINKGTPGLNGIIRARRYSAEEYIYAINNYPKFWQSVRNNTLKSTQFSKEIENGINKLRGIYPSLKPIDIYFEIGVLRTGGTTNDGMVLIGSEVALADQSVISSELDSRYPHLKNHFNTNPINNVVFLNVHEYIHTQQKETIGNTLLSQTIMEGVAEFLAEITLAKKSPNPQIDFGYKNEERIKIEYVKEMFSPNIYNWIMNSPKNQFGMRDLGYFVGYAICKKYYELSTNKMLAVKEMIELDYNSESELIKFVENTKYFNRPLSFYKAEFEKKRPRVLGINSRKVNPHTTTFTIDFSEEMDPNFRNFELGPLGEKNLLKITKVAGFSEDHKSFTFEANFEPDKQYQILVNSGFRSKKQYPLIPYLIDFRTTTKK